jgi:hypothetical protein
MEYYFDELDPVNFQRLVNTILISRFGEDARLTPLRGRDGGRDGETAPENPYLEFEIGESLPEELKSSLWTAPKSGRYLFQAKHHRTTERRLSDVRQAVVRDFASELKKNVLPRMRSETVNYFFIVTNVPAGEDAIEKIDRERAVILKGVTYLHADIWWKETVVAFLDLMPQIWRSFPGLFAGHVVPFIANIPSQDSGRISRAIRIAIHHQFLSDRNVKFRQIELEQSLSRLFVDLDFNTKNLPSTTRRDLNLIQRRLIRTAQQTGMHVIGDAERYRRLILERRLNEGVANALDVLLQEEEEKSTLQKLLIEGGPGQGKSTLTQMAVQIYRQAILSLAGPNIEYVGRFLSKQRLPFRIELRSFAEWLSNNPKGSVEGYLSGILSRDAGGSNVTVQDIHTAVECSPVLLVFDGLDEIGSDDLRDSVLEALLDCIQRFETGLKTDLRVIVTTRPPALTGRSEKFHLFERLSLAPLTEERIRDYLERWIEVQISEVNEQNRIRDSFNRRRNEPHVKALARNPMQLSVLLQFIYLKGEAFPDRKAELYRDYFQIVIDRDVEKSPALRENRQVIEALHGYLGYRIHALTEINQADRTLERGRLIEMVQKWLNREGHTKAMATKFFRLGEERFGLVVASKGEGEQTRYGFEVQPIQEYFAAAYISNQVLSSCAHDAFEPMIRRPYWREVASFLAGLRRPNEKVDLVARARNVDGDKEFGWRQDGRSLILQLLQEGVFSQPRYAFAEALEYVMDLLDTQRYPFRSEPNEFLPALLSVMQDVPERVKDKIKCLLDEHSDCHDYYALYRLYRVAAYILDIDEYQRAVENHHSKDPYIRSCLHLRCPYNSTIDVAELLRLSGSWDEAPASVWGRTWWQEATRSGIVLSLNPPDAIHESLVEQLAVDPTAGTFRRHMGFFIMQSKSNLSVWRIIQLLEALQLVSPRLLGGIPQDKNVLEAISFLLDKTDSLSYRGLDSTIDDLIRNAIDLMTEVLTTIVTEEERSNNIAANLSRLKTHLGLPGIGSWIAARCLVSVMQTIALSGTRAAYFSQPIRKALGSMTDNLFAFYTSSTTAEEKNLVRSLSRIAMHGEVRYLPYRYLRPFLPHSFDAVRLALGTPPTSIIDILERSIRTHQPLPVPWFQRIVFLTSLIRPLIERCNDCLPDALKLMGKMNFIDSPIPGERRLRVQDTRRILDLARRSKDSDQIRGVATALRVAKFDRIAKPELLLKILKLTHNSALGTMLFRKDQTPVREEETTSAEKRALEIITHEMFENPGDFGFKELCRAAILYSTQCSPSLPPLAKIESNLKIINGRLTVKKDAPYV